jgi:hypothetical protein
LILTARTAGNLAANGSSSIALWNDLNRLALRNSAGRDLSSPVVRKFTLANWSFVLDVDRPLVIKEIEKYLKNEKIKVSVPYYRRRAPYSPTIEAHPEHVGCPKSGLYIILISSERPI